MSRTIDELLALGTYQGMSDDEIQTIIDFKCRCAADAAAAQARNEETASHVAQVRDALNRSKAHSHARFEAAMAATPIFRTVGNDE